MSFEKPNDSKSPNRRSFIRDVAKGSMFTAAISGTGIVASINHESRETEQNNNHLFSPRFIAEIRHKTGATLDQISELESNPILIEFIESLLARQVRSKKQIEN